jgi:hypothetical protein
MTDGDRGRDYRGLHRLEVLVAATDGGDAAALEAGLRDLGCVVPPPATSVGDALALLRAFRPDLALLDAGLAGGRPAAVAEALAGMGVPFVLVLAPGDDPAPGDDRPDDDDDDDDDEGGIGDGPALRLAPRLRGRPGPGELRRTVLDLARRRPADRGRG